QSPLAGQASWVFDCHPAEDTNVFTPMSSRLTQLTLLDALQVALALKLGTSAEENLRLTKRSLGLSRLDT
ncbi:MAG: RpiR family carbohydrate utilization transcriptional regulator, partial [Candidatus Azotimanducaceae bacterium]